VDIPLISYDAQSSHAALAWPVPVQPVYGAARLNINRIPDLGNFVVVRLWIDGMWAGSIAYGHTYEGLLPPGRHVLTVLAGPNPKWWIPSQLILDVRSGQTYNFIAMGRGDDDLDPGLHSYFASECGERSRSLNSCQRCRFPISV
jgi:hypothetical protein